MTTVADKLALIYDTKSKIRDAVNLKGGAILETTAFTEYPEAILDLPVEPQDTNGRRTLLGGILKRLSKMIIPKDTGLFTLG
jgi:hypothetical protein